jgi:hypothetical protein
MRQMNQKVDLMVWTPGYGFGIPNAKAKVKPGHAKHAQTKAASCQSIALNLTAMLKSGILPHSAENI